MRKTTQKEKKIPKPANNHLSQSKNSRVITIAISELKIQISDTTVYQFTSSLDCL
jgi:hypothetical protein